MARGYSLRMVGCPEKNCLPFGVFPWYFRAREIDMGNPGLASGRGLDGAGSLRLLERNVNRRFASSDQHKSALVHVGESASQFGQTLHFLPVDFDDDIASLESGFIVL